jgi:class 3 adenylate cyclase
LELVVQGRSISRTEIYEAARPAAMPRCTSGWRGSSYRRGARVQELATAGQVLATKPLVELLDAAEATELAIDPELVTYQTLAQLPQASEKALRDAATLAVTNLG